MTTWREQLAPIIRGIIEEHGTEDMKSLRRVLRDKCPIYPRAYHPYKIWLDEIKVQLGQKKPKRKPVEEDPNQAKLF